MAREPMPELVRLGVGLSLLGLRDMNDERVIRGASFCGVDLFRAFAVCGVAAQTVDGFGRENHGSAALQYFGGGREGFRARIFGVNFDQ